jgi:DNA-binding NarL/FixJ family response regulator
MPTNGQSLATATGHDTPAIARVRVLIVDDSEAVRNGLSLLLSSRPSCEVVAAVDDMDSALAHVRDASPHVVLLDFSMPELDPFALIRGLDGCRPRPAVLMLSALANEGSTRRAMAAGAVGWVLKDAEPEALFAALLRAARSAAAGGALTGRAPAANGLGAEGGGTSSADPRTVRALLRALQGNASGATAEEVAASAVVSPRAARRHLTRLAMRPPAYVTIACGASAACRYILTPAGEQELERLERHIAAAGPRADASASPAASVRRRSSRR